MQALGSCGGPLIASQMMGHNALLPACDFSDYFSD
jgi:hypothetical protein